MFVECGFKRGFSLAFTPTNNTVVRPAARGIRPFSRRFPASRGACLDAHCRRLNNRRGLVRDVIATCDNARIRTGILYRLSGDMFDSVPLAPPDAILGISEAFRNDPRSAKINLSVGVYKDAGGRTPIMRCVKRAEERLLREEQTKDYIAIQGAEAYTAHVQRLLLPPGHDLLASGRLATVQTPGGTAALRVAADFLQKNLPRARVWLSDPTWPNHPSVFQAAGREIRTYPYFDPSNNELNFPAMLAALREIPEGDVVLLHGCCHNPTGVDPTPSQWAQIAEVVAERKLLPLVDFAYQGLAEGIREDAAGLLSFIRPDVELLIASSFSKNFGLYNERVGALTAV